MRIITYIIVILQFTSISVEAVIHDLTHIMFLLGMPFFLGGLKPRDRIATGETMCGLLGLSLLIRWYLSHRILSIFTLVMCVVIVSTYGTMRSHAAVRSGSQRIIDDSDLLRTASVNSDLPSEKGGANPEIPPKNAAGNPSSPESTSPIQTLPQNLSEESTESSDLSSSTTYVLPPFAERFVAGGPTFFNTGVPTAYQQTHYQLGRRVPTDQMGLSMESALVRGYYLNDQRIQWTGMEATFGAESIVTPVYRHRDGDWVSTIKGEFYLNLPFEKNRFYDDPERRSYAANWERETFEISQLYVGMRNEAYDCEVQIGKIWTPFGRFEERLYTNQRLDAPFLRTEVIPWREIGVLLRYDPKPFVLDVGIVNGGHDLDTNSSKALVSRVGLESERWQVGMSVKVQDGIGSEDQKTYNNVCGMDASVRMGRWKFASEVCYDQHGLYHDYDPNQIFWQKSIYYRDVNKAEHEAIGGWGWYLTSIYEGNSWYLSGSYGMYTPEKIGNIQHDRAINRGIAKAAYCITPQSQFYSSIILETDGFIAQCDRLRDGTTAISGFEIGF